MSQYTVCVLVSNAKKKKTNNKLIDVVLLIDIAKKNDDFIIQVNICPMIILDILFDSFFQYLLHTYNLPHVYTYSHIYSHM